MLALIFAHLLFVDFVNELFLPGSILFNFFNFTFRFFKHSFEFHLFSFVGILLLSAVAVPVQFRGCLSSPLDKPILGFPMCPRCKSNLHSGRRSSIFQKISLHILGIRIVSTFAALLSKRCY